MKSNELENSVYVERVVSRVAGHIRKPLTLLQIVRQVEGNDYSAEMMLQHLLRWASGNMKARMK